MASLIQELQRDALDSSVSTLELLRKALVVATKLNISEFEEWIEFELSGYSNGKNTPSYRYIVGSVKAWHPYGLIPVVGDEDTMSQISKMSIQQSIAELEDLITRSNRCQTFFEFHPQIQDILRQVFQSDTVYRLEIHISQIKKYQNQ